MASESRGVRSMYHHICMTLLVTIIFLESSQAMGTGRQKRETVCSGTSSSFLTDLATNDPPPSPSDNPTQAALDLEKIKIKMTNYAAIKSMNIPDNVHMEDGSFSDVDYSTRKGTELHLDRLGYLAYIDLQTSSELKDKTRLSFIYITYNATNFIDKNWWPHLIGVPQKAWRPIFTATAKDAIDHTTRDAYMNKYFVETQEGPVWNTSHHFSRFAGGNFAPRAILALYEAFIGGFFEERREEVVERMYVEAVDRNPYGGNGVRPDGCLHQHNLETELKNDDGTEYTEILSQLYSSNYGKEFLKYTGQMLWLLDDTLFAFGDTIKQGIAASFFDCQKWLYRGTIVEPTSTGRFIDSGKIVTHQGTKDTVASTMAYYELINLRETDVEAAKHRYENNIPDEQFALIGNRHFFTSDVMAHQRRSFMATVRMLSRRTMRVEVKDENPFGYYQADGFLNVVANGNELGSLKREVMQVYDWARIPGTTIQYTPIVTKVRTGPTYRTHAYNDHHFVGGVTNGNIGATVMFYNRPTVALTATKTWFFFDDLILCLGSNINLPSTAVNDNQVSTTLAQLMYGGTATVGFSSTSPDVEYVFNTVTDEESKSWTSTETQWIHHDSIGYFIFDTNKQINIKIDTKSITGQQDLQKFSLWLDHGKSPTDESYAYALLPTWTVSETRAFASNPTVNNIHKTNIMHAACHSNKVFMVVLFSDGCFLIDSCLSNNVQEICSDKAGMFILSDISSSANIDCTDCPTTKQFPNSQSEASPKIQISVADPTQKLSQLELTVKSSTLGDLTTTVTLPESPKGGESVRFCIK